MNKELFSWLNKWLSAYLVVLSLIVLVTGVLIFTRPLILGTVDLSWPNCNRLGNGDYSSVIVGSSGGLDFRPNPCLGNEARLSNNYLIYTNTGNPGFPRIRQLGISGPLHCQSTNSFLCYSFNYGYQAAQYSMRQADLAAAAGSTFWWLDVETINSWTSSIDANRADIMGMVYALKSSRFLKPNVGIYTANNQWVALVGHWDIELPLWLGTGDTSYLQAAQACKQASITGGPILLSQYTIANLDFNFRCQPMQMKKLF